jgi:hypothetical protein
VTSDKHPLRRNVFAGWLRLSHHPPVGIRSVTRARCQFGPPQHEKEVGQLETFMTAKDGPVSSVWKDDDDFGRLLVLVAELETRRDSDLGRPERSRTAEERHRDLFSDR